ncbi:glutaminyl-peptide cyclotransferase [Muriicola sp.]|uniref:glutaminyl-peptide cyclotransferase n=1 Tax=Muriicola sp. TaxID=2020856 RepID=UPI003C714862
MNFIKYFILNGLILFVVSCGGEKDPSSLFSLQFTSGEKEFQQFDTIRPVIENRKDLPIDSIRFTIAGEEIPFRNDQLVLQGSKLGLQTIKVHFRSEGNPIVVETDIKILAPAAPELYTYEIINEYPHDIKAFTQGLEFYQDTLYESTGSGGGAKSFIRKLDFKTGGIYQQVDLDTKYFGEGITLLHDKVYQLTWQSKLGFLYRVSDLKQIDRFQYGQSKEGWGLCNDGSRIYKSDGTERIWLLNPETLVEEDNIQIVTNKSIFNKANELEYVDGKIYANVWQKESMMIIDAGSGAIEGVVNLGGLKEKVKQHAKLDVLNGIAYHPGRKTFFVTGKNWDTLFEIQLKKKE